VHAETVTAIQDLLNAALGGRARVRVQQPIRLDVHSEPQPDIVVATAKSYRDAHPTPADVLLVVEVADSSLRYDQSRKLPAYARSGIGEAWLVDLATSRIEVHRDPVADRYTKVSSHHPGDVIEPEAFPGVRLTVADMLP
jgi:Uma2 family endonuclease